jgi:hypothetical protein
MSITVIPYATARHANRRSEAGPDSACGRAPPEFNLSKANGADIKVMQELLRHPSTRVTLDRYTQAVTPAKRAAQTEMRPSASRCGRPRTWNQRYTPSGPRLRLLKHQAAAQFPSRASRPRSCEEGISKNGNRCRSPGIARGRDRRLSTGAS